MKLIFKLLVFTLIGTLTFAVPAGFALASSPDSPSVTQVVPDDNDDNQHPSGKDKETNNGPADDSQGKSPSEPDQNGKGPERDHEGTDKPGGPGGKGKEDQDGNNGCGNDDDFEDDNEGLCGGKPKPTKAAEATAKPSESPKPTNTVAPTKGAEPTVASSPTPAETVSPTVVPSEVATAVPSVTPTQKPTQAPSEKPCSNEQGCEDSEFEAVDEVPVTESVAPITPELSVVVVPGGNVMGPFVTQPAPVADTATLTISELPVTGRGGLGTLALIGVVLLLVGFFLTRRK